MPVELFSNDASTTVTAGGTTTSDTSFTVSSSTLFPPASSTTTPPSQFRIVDLNDAQQPHEVMIVTNVSGRTWTVTRGAEGTAAVAHAANWTATHVETAGAIGANLTALISQMFYGAGGDGTITYSANAVLATDIHAGPGGITIDAGVTVTPNGFRIYSQGPVLNNGTIDFSGNAASGATAGSTTGSYYANFGKAGAGAAGGTGAGAAAGAALGYPIPPGINELAKIGGAGGASGATAGGAGGEAVLVNTGSTYTTHNRFEGDYSPIPFFGTGYPWAAGNSGAPTAGGYLPFNGAPGGGAGAGDGTNAGGGGGGGAGGIFIAAPSIVNNGTISAVGGAGAAGVAGNAGGGGGGGGGWLMGVTQSYSGNAPVLTGGAGGAGAGTGGAGAAGLAGTNYLVVL